MLSKCNRIVRIRNLCISISTSVSVQQIQCINTKKVMAAPVADSRTRTSMNDISKAKYRDGCTLDSNCGVGSRQQNISRSVTEQQ